MSGNVRVRFAPSPTGYFHVGSARAALFNWLFARQNNGTFVLRIEDTDEERNREEWTDGIISALAWLGMEPDEGPYHQSERTDNYRAAIELLWNAGFLYPCDCSREAIDGRAKSGGKPGYDGYCRDRGLDRSDGLALRFRIPKDGGTLIDDLVRGEVFFPHSAMEDFICVKGTGKPLFVLANVVDDRDMAISHVIRGEDLLPTTPKQVLLWEALNAATEAEMNSSSSSDIRPLPLFAHLPLLVNEARKKLSKRRDPVAVESYQAKGYLPVAFRNYLALLGWSPKGGHEKVTLEVMIDQFDLREVNHAPAFFDVQKLTHLNGEYIREMSVEEFIEACRPWIDPDVGTVASAGTGMGVEGSANGVPWSRDHFDLEVFKVMAPLVQERVSTLGEVPAMIDFFFLTDVVIDEEAWQKSIERDENAGFILQQAREIYATCTWERDVLHDVTGEIGKALGRALGKTQAPIRVAVTGRRVGPPLFESMQVLGREEVLKRIDAILDRIDAAHGVANVDVGQ